MGLFFGVTDFDQKPHSIIQNLFPVNKSYVDELLVVQTKIDQDHQDRVNPFLTTHNNFLVNGLVTYDL